MGRVRHRWFGTAWCELSGSIVSENQKWLHPHVWHLNLERLAWHGVVRVSLFIHSLSPSQVAGPLCMAANKAKVEAAGLLRAMGWKLTQHQVHAFSLLVKAIHKASPDSKRGEIEARPLMGGVAWASKESWNCCRCICRQCTTALTIKSLPCGKPQV